MLAKKNRNIEVSKHKIVNLKNKPHGFPMLDPVETSNIIENLS